MKKLCSISFLVILTIGLTACEKPNFIKNEEVIVEVSEKKVEQADRKIELKEENEEVVTEESETKVEELEQEESEQEKLAVEKEETEIMEDEEQVDTEQEEKEPLVAVSQKTLLILDASGSMWGQIDGKSKIEIAKEVVKKTVKNFETTELGLMAYGHRRKGDCSDIEILTDPKKDNAENISKMVDNISPKGMTPMGNSVLMAAEALKYTEQKATVILISDGIETCEIDLCKLGKKLEETGVDFTAHVIGFDMTEEQTAGLKCLASETGGQFMTAKDSDSLSEALEEAVEASACSKEKLGEATLNGPLEVPAGSSFEITFEGPKNKGDSIRILPKDSIEVKAQLDYFNVGNNSKLTAPEEIREYDIVYFANCGEILGRISFVTTPVTATLSVPETVAAGSSFKVTYVGPNNRGDQVVLKEKGAMDNKNALGYFNVGNNSNLIVPEEIGEYDVIYFTNDDKILARDTFTVTPVAATLSVPETVAAGSKFEVTYKAPKNRGDQVVLKEKGAMDNKNALDYFNAGNNPKLIAPEEIGEYDVIYFTNDDKILARDTFTVTPVTATLSTPATVVAGSRFEVTYVGPNNRGDQILLKEKGAMGDKKSLDYFNVGNNSKLTAPEEVGEYDVIYFTNGGNILARATFTVTK